MDSVAVIRDNFGFSPSLYIILSILCNPTEFLVSELQAAHIIKHKELHPEENSTGEESEKEQRVQSNSHIATEFCQEYEDADESEKNRRKSEMQAEWILLLHALGLDASSQFEDVLSEVSLQKEAG